MPHSEQLESRCNHPFATPQHLPTADETTAQEEDRVDPLRYKSAERLPLRIIPRADSLEFPSYGPGRIRLYVAKETSTC